MPLFWELFGLRSWDRDEVDRLDLSTYEWMSKVARQVAKQRKKGTG